MRQSLGPLVLEVEDEENFRQGDIIRKIPNNAIESVRWGFVLTADCDIANQKINDRLTWLEIVSAHEYLENFWSHEQLRRFVSKQSQIAADMLNAFMKRKGLSLAPVTTQSVCEWLYESDETKIVAMISSSSTNNESSLLQALKVLRVALRYEAPASNMDCLCSVWSLTGLSQKNRMSKIKESFGSEKGFPDMILVPNIPLGDQCGFVILLRSMESLFVKDLFRSELDARINDKPNAFHRIGRFDDSVRFSVSQKMAFLFSRIGMSVEFEDDCERAANSLIETRNYLTQKEVI